MTKPGRAVLKPWRNHASRPRLRAYTSQTRATIFFEENATNHLVTKYAFDIFQGYGARVLTLACVYN